MLDVLRKIGALLRREATQPRDDERVVEYAELPQGAGGDRTHPLDAKAEETIFAHLRASGEPLTVISEEAGRMELNGGGGRTVVIDPLDGSRNAILGIPFYGTSIAVASGQRVGDVELGYVINLMSGEEFWAQRGKGAFRNGVRISTQGDDVLRGISFEAQTPGRDVPRIIGLLEATMKARCMGSIALDLAYLATGASSIFVVPSASRSFDYAAGWLLVQEAGGVFTDIAGASLEGMPLGLEKDATLLAAGNAALHKKALALLKA